MKVSKKVVSILCAVAMVVSAMSAFAAEPAAEDINASLLSRGYPQLYLDNVSESVKESLYNKPDAVFDGATVTVFDEATGEFSSYDIPADGISAQGQIPSGDLVLTWGVSRYTTGNVLITYSYEWRRLPINRFQDPIGISWDSQRFEMVDNSFYKIDQYKALTSDSIVTKTHSESRSYASASPSGVTWYADLPGHHLANNGILPIFGHGEFLLRPKSQSTFTTTFYGHYVHQITAGSLSLAIPKYGLGFSISGGAGYDELGNQRTYTY